MNAKTTIVFDLTCITIAVAAAWHADEAWRAMTSDMLQWHESGEYPDNQAVAEAVAATDRYTVTRSGTGAIKGSCATIASNILKWARSGRTPRNINECVTKAPENHVKGKAGRKAGKGAGKTTKPVEAAADGKAPMMARDPASLDDVLLMLRTLASKVNTLGLSAEAAAGGREALVEAIAFFVGCKVAE